MQLLHATAKDEKLLCFFEFVHERLSSKSAYATIAPSIVQKVWISSSAPFGAAF